MAEPTNEDLKLLMKKMVHEVDLQKTGVKVFTALLSQELGGIDLSAKKGFIKKTLSDIISSMDDDDDSDESEEEEEDEDEDEDEDGDEAVQPKKRRKTSSGGGLAACKEVSPELAAFLGKGNRMARTEIVKELWNYIRQHNLQNPENKREILLDDAMKNVFRVDSFTMFTMNKYIGAHVYPFKPVDLTTNSMPTKRKQPKEKKPRKPGTQAPYQLSPELARVTGKQILPRPQVTKALWAYIRKHNLQNPEDKREILCDAKLKAVMGGKDKVTMFTMNKHITPHLLEKLDKSCYTHEDEDDAVSRNGVSEDSEDTQDI